MKKIPRRSTSKFKGGTVEHFPGAAEIARTLARIYDVVPGLAEPFPRAAEIAQEATPELWDYPRLFWEMKHDFCPPLLLFDLAGLMVFDISDHLNFFPKGEGTQGEEAAVDMDRSRNRAAFRCALLALPMEFAYAGVIPPRFPQGPEDRSAIISSGWERLWMWQYTVLSPACDPTKPLCCARLRAIRKLVRIFGKTHYPDGVGRHFDKNELGHDAETALRSAGLPDVGGVETAMERMKKGLSIHLYNGRNGKARIAWRALRDDICKENKIRRRRNKPTQSLNTPLPSGQGDRGDLVVGKVSNAPRYSPEALAIGALIGLDSADAAGLADERWESVERIVFMFSNGASSDRAALQHEAFGISHAKKGRGKQEYSLKRLSARYATTPKAIRCAARRLHAALNDLRRPGE